MAGSTFDELSLHSTAEGTEVPIRVAPNARRSAVAGLWQRALRIQVAAPPHEGKANDELAAFLARLFAIPRRSVIVRSGERCKDKVVLLRGVREERIRARLADEA